MRAFGSTRADECEAIASFLTDSLTKDINVKSATSSPVSPVQQQLGSSRRWRV
jgi:hypothetical protein